MMPTNGKFRWWIICRERSGTIIAARSFSFPANGAKTYVNN
jgi:hypothetical protein